MRLTNIKNQSDNDNKKGSRLKIITAVLFSATLTACGGGSESTETPTTPGQGTTNQAPIAVAGSDQTFDLGLQANLDGSSSYDPDGDNLTFSWSFNSRPTGSAVSLNNATSANANFTPDLAGVYTISLIVNDGTTNSTPDTIVITVDEVTPNNAPIARAGDDQNVQLGATVTLNGTASSDEDGDTLTYAWRIITKPQGSNASLANANRSEASITPDQAGSYEFGLVVNDGQINSAEDSTTVVVTQIQQNQTPTADAGSDQRALLGETVVLDGSRSSDPEGDTLTYSWTIANKPSTSNVSIVNSTQQLARITPDVSGQYEITLVVNDGQLTSTADSVLLTIAEPASNSAPIANAGADITVEQGATVTLSGAGSSDPDGDQLAYQWQFTSKPSSSAASLINAETTAPSFIADKAGDYTVQLIVYDDAQLSSSPDSVTVTVTSRANTTPVANAGNDSIAYLGQQINLDGSNSSDADNDTLTYLWTIDDMPSGSSATISAATQAMASFTPDIEGSYLLSLVVNDGTTSSESDTLLINVANWLTNTSERSSYITQNGQGVLVNVQSVSSTTAQNQKLISFTSTGIPNYAVTMTQEHIDALNNRPNARVDFSASSGKTTAKVGDVIEFGQDIGYEITRAGCALGYWPPGPACPSNQNKTSVLPAQPEPAQSDCATGLNYIGIMLNGTAVFNWDDGQSYNSQNIWNNLAPKFEVYDVDVCLGHAQQQGNYHHHMFSKCLQDLMNDTGDTHSPIYGFAADGYPIHGPYYTKGVLAKPSWQKRDYDNINSETGCGEANKRSCQLVDQYDVSKGVVAVTSGPDTNGSVNSMSGNPISTVTGVYFEDYYHDQTLAALGNEYLDKHNGHNHDNYGYHYHITAEANGTTLDPVFPYQIGPTFYGALPSSGLASCSR